MTALILLSEWQKSQIEFWLPVAGFPSYDVSSMGRVRSWFTNVPTILKFDSSTRDGRLRVTLYRRLGGKRQSKRFLVHRLVALLFIDNPLGFPVVNHLTGIPRNNWVLNLEWTTRAANEQHAKEHGLKAHGERMYNAILTEQKVREIRALGEQGISGRKIGRIFNIDQSSVWAICHRKAWRHVV